MLGSRQVMRAGGQIGILTVIRTELFLIAVGWGFPIEDQILDGLPGHLYCGAL